MLELPKLLAAKMWQTVLIIKISYKPYLNSLLIRTRFVKVPCSFLLQLGESSTTAWWNSAGLPIEDHGPQPHQRKRDFESSEMLELTKLLAAKNVTNSLKYQNIL